MIKYKINIMESLKAKGTGPVYKLQIKEGKNLWRSHDDKVQE